MTLPIFLLLRRPGCHRPLPERKSATCSIPVQPPPLQDQMETMMREANPGLARRFQLSQAWHFEDYSSDDLAVIMRDAARSKCARTAAPAPHCGAGHEVPLHQAGARHSRGPCPASLGIGFVCALARVFVPNIHDLLLRLLPRRAARYGWDLGLEAIQAGVQALEVERRKPK